MPFPDALRGKYQSFTQADITGLRKAGYREEFLTVEQGVPRYLAQRGAATAPAAAIAAVGTTPTLGSRAGPV